MAITKTLRPTNVTISIPDFTDQPDQRVNSNCIDKEADAINTLSEHLTTATTVKTHTFAGSIAVKRCGNVCFLSCVSGTYSNSAAWGTLTYTVGSSTGTLIIPSGYRPAMTVELKDTNASKRITVEPATGNVTCAEAVSGASLRFSTCWITADDMPSWPDRPSR